MVLLFAGCLAAGFALLSGGPVASGLCDLIYKSPPSSYFSLHKIASLFSGLDRQNWLGFAKPMVFLSNPFGLRPGRYQTGSLGGKSSIVLCVS